MTNELDRLRQQGVKWITLGGWGATFAIGLLSVPMGRQALVACGISALLNLLPTLATLTKRADVSARYAVALMAALQPALLLYAMRGAEWQIDMHMYFFVGLAVLTILCDPRPILLAAATIAAHHLLLAFLSPTWVFSGGGGIERVLVHALAVVLQAGALSYLAMHLGSVLSRLGQAVVESERAKVEATDALRQADQERAARVQAELEQAESRRADMLRIAQEFESSVAELTASVAKSAEELDRAMDTLDETVKDTGREASEVAASASQVSNAAGHVAHGVTKLSHSISNIAVTAGQQDTLASTAGARSTSGVAAVGSLSGHSMTIGEATKSIASVAAKTNLLALNAAIEAASAGDAGRGFAVVAQEVKDLANQAARATDQIDELLSGVQSGTLEAETSFAELSETIAEVARSAAAIKNDVDSQRSVAASIESNASETAQGTDEMARRSASLAQNASTTEKLFSDTRGTVKGLLENIRSLESSANRFVANIKVA
ncbi:methyl-accepting chemotaxis protein [Parerythrobacter aestuarii]|uniref:methyl-accepting chemotaxis protein n=1 Tax=Parerythrobacter aestuarii TaxID=3020909 RepID=UPI0024DED78A|nr:methyl-accepting chemotaxis protein [Parerythrobacter aestuarii]